MSANQPAAKKSVPWNLIAAGIAAAVAIAWLFANRDDTTVSFLFTSVTMPLWLVILISMALGAAITWFLTWRSTKA